MDVAHGFGWPNMAVAHAHTGTSRIESYHDSYLVWSRILYGDDVQQIKHTMLVYVAVVGVMGTIVSTSGVSKPGQGRG